MGPVREARDGVAGEGACPSGLSSRFRKHHGDNLVQFDFTAAHQQHRFSALETDAIDDANDFRRHINGSAAAADNVNFTIRDSNGVSVFTNSAPAPAGKNAFIWDGQTDNGLPAPDGEYTLTVTAVDSSGTAINVNTDTPSRMWWDSLAVKLR